MKLFPTAKEKKIASNRRRLGNLKRNKLYTGDLRKVKDKFTKQQTALIRKHRLIANGDSSLYKIPRGQLNFYKKKEGSKIINGKLQLPNLSVLDTNQRLSKDGILSVKDHATGQRVSYLLLYEIADLKRALKNNRQLFKLKKDEYFVFTYYGNYSRSVYASSVTLIEELSYYINIVKNKPPYLFGIKTYNTSYKKRFMRVQKSKRSRQARLKSIKKLLG